ncbi:zinc-binding alcohol dehydrogenase family protein [Streptomyces smyrnaeus]|uniref:quinone oxidoreductase family protein n=1 Tax=Streptomyces smyrnaeus TaxID=1387713 RepID=UPI003684CC12
MRAMRFGRFGGPGALEEADVPDPLAGPGESVVQVEAAGVNFGDIKQIAGEHTDGPCAPQGPLPRTPGMEVVGRTAAGQRVLGYVPQGGYAAKTVVADRHLVALPPGGEALALPPQGLTAWHLPRSVVRIRPGESVVVHAAAGGTCSLLVQLAREFGAGLGALALAVARQEVMHGTRRMPSRGGAVRAAPAPLGVLQVEIPPTTFSTVSRSPAALRPAPG